MRFAMLMVPNVTSEDWTPSPEAVAAMTRYNQELEEAGVLRSLDGFHPTSEGARVCFGGGEPVVEAGPFDAPRQTVGGYWLIDVPSRQSAVEWASRCPASDGDVIEIRQVFEMSEFPEDVQAAASAAQ